LILIHSLSCFRHAWDDRRNKAARNKGRGYFFIRVVLLQNYHLIDFFSQQWLLICNNYLLIMIIS